MVKKLDVTVFSFAGSRCRSSRSWNVTRCWQVCSGVYDSKYRDDSR